MKIFFLGALAVTFMAVSCEQQDWEHTKVLLEPSDEAGEPVTGVGMQQEQAKAEKAMEEDQGDKE